MSNKVFKVPPSEASPLTANLSNEVELPTSTFKKPVELCVKLPLILNVLGVFASLMFNVPLFVTLPFKVESAINVVTPFSVIPPSEVMLPPVSAYVAVGET